MDMEEFFAILRTQPSIKDGTMDVPACPPAHFLGSKGGGADGSSSGSTAALGSSTNGCGAWGGSGTLPLLEQYGSSTGAAAAAAATAKSETNGRYGSSADAAGSSGSSVGSSGKGSSGSSVGGGLHIELRDVQFGYTHERQILRGVSLSVAPGRSVAVVGPSGSGEFGQFTFSSVVLLPAACRQHPNTAHPLLWWQLDMCCHVWR